MLNVQRTSLRSRVSRRIFGVFLLCALIPFAGLVLVSSKQVTRFFNDKTELQLRALTKTVGMETYERLLLLEAGLQIIAGKIESSGTIPTEADLEALASNPKVRWEALAVVTGDDQRQRLFGAVETFPALTVQQRSRLASGKPVLLTVSSAAPEPGRIFMALNTRAPRQRTVIGEVKAGYLWNIAESSVLPSYIKLCALEISGITLTCSFADAALPGRLLEKIGSSALGTFDWTENDAPHHASYWTIPIKFEFQTSEWIVILLASKEGIFASLAELHDTFVLWTAVCIGLSLLLALNQIRKRLVPVEKLQEATQRVAQNDFSCRVDIRSTDEFQDLALSFNAMTAQLGQQFATLNTTAGIQRAVLSLLDTKKIAETILGRMMTVLGCDAASLTIFGSPGENRDATFLVRAGAGGLESPQAPDAGLVARRVAENEAPLTIDDLSAHPRFRASEWIGEQGFRSCLGAPLLINGRTFGGLTFYSSAARIFTPADLSFVMGLASEAAIAVYNSQLYERTTRQAAELEVANRVKDEFLAVMSHELRTPINVILGYLTLVQDRMLGDINDEQERALGTVSKHSKDLLGLIERIMEVMNIDNGGLVAECHDVAVPGLLDELKQQFSEPLEKEIEVSWTCDAELPVLRTDRHKLTRILHTLIENAIKFTERGRVTVAASWSAERGSLDFEVADTGVGIPRHAIPLLFQKFRQADSSANRQHEGVGLGLYIAKRLADLLGAEMKVRSEPGKGSTFKVVFHLLAAEAEPSSRVELHPTVNPL